MQNDVANIWKRAAGSILQRADRLPAEAVTVPCARLDTYFRDATSANETFALCKRHERRTDVSY